MTLRLRGIIRQRPYTCHRGRVLAAAIETVHHLHRFHGPGVDYAGVGIAALIGWVGVPGVGEAALVAAGIAAAHHRIDISGVLVVAWAGAALGGMTGWLIGIKGGNALMTAPGPLLKLRARMLRSGERLYRRHGALAVYFGPAWLAGVNAMRAARFLPANAVAALVWAALIGLGSYLVGPSVTDIVGDIGLVGVALVVVLAAVAGGARARSRR
jgi:membrane protein DedA with SNARE-associated domain